MAPRFFVVVPYAHPPIAISLLIFLPKGKEHEIQNLMPTKFCASDGPAVPSSILCSCWTSRVRTPVAVSHTSCTHTAWIEWIAIKNAATAAMEMATGPCRQWQGGGLQDVSTRVDDDANVMHFPVGSWGINTCRPKFSDFLFEILTSIQTNVNYIIRSKIRDW